MNQNNIDNQAVKEFKGNVSAVKSYLSSVGYDIQTSHLLEAITLYENQPNYATFRAKLSKNNVAKVASPFNLKGKTVEVTFAGHSVSEDEDLFGQIVLTVDQEWLDNLVAKTTLAKTQGIKVIDGADLEFDGFEEANIEGGEIHIYHDEFYLAGDLYENDQVQSPLVNTKEFIFKVMAAIPVGKLTIY